MPFKQQQNRLKPTTKHDICWHMLLRHTCLLFQRHDAANTQWRASTRLIGVDWWQGWGREASATNLLRVAISWPSTEYKTPSEPPHTHPELHPRILSRNQNTKNIRRSGVFVYFSELIFFGMFFVFGFRERIRGIFGGFRGALYSVKGPGGRFQQTRSHTSTLLGEGALQTFTSRLPETSSTFVGPKASFQLLSLAKLSRQDILGVPPDNGGVCL